MMVKFLEWDSNFFDKKIGLLSVVDNYDKIDSFFSYDVIYVNQEEDEEIKIPGFEKLYEENKITYSKKLKSNLSSDNNIFSVFNIDYNIDEIYSLAYESGKFSRFKLDPAFTEIEYRELYKTWVNNSINKSIANNILIYKDNNEIKGFVSYRVKENYAQIGLIAISPSIQGKGVGSKLIKAIENELINIGVKELRIQTQLINTVACNFYLKLGYIKSKVEFFKHFWKI